MTIIVDEKARAFLAKHNTAAVHVYLGGCRTWGGTIPQPAVLAGLPNSVSNYTEFSVDGITVYVRNGTEAENDTLTITTTKMLWVESLSVEGMVY